MNNKGADVNTWKDTDKIPQDGSYIWACVLEHDGYTVHVEPGVVWNDTDGLFVNLSEAQSSPWPGSVVRWKYANEPAVPKYVMRWSEFRRAVIAGKDSMR